MGHVPLLECGMVTPSLRPILRAFGNCTSVEMLTECSFSLGAELASAGVIVWAQGMYGSASFFVFLFLRFGTGLLSVSLAVLELWRPRLTSESEICLFLPPMC